MHREEEVIRPVIFGNNYDPLQEVILNEEGWGREGRGLSVGGDCGCREVAVEVCTCYISLTPTTWFCSTWYLGLLGTQLGTSSRDPGACCTYKELRVF